MMLGDPIARKAERFRMRGEIGGIGERLPDGAALHHGDEIEQGVAGHAC